MSKKFIAGFSGLLVAAALFGGVVTAHAETMTAAQIQAAIAALMTQLNALGGTTTTTTSCYAFTRDLTLGSTGADVSALQATLVAKGFLVMPVGVPMGYFGGLTRAAVAKWQIANGVAPAAGYFGPLSRGKYTALCTTTTTTTTTTSTSTTSTGSSTSLKGGEADLRNFDLRAGNDLREGDTNQEIALATFDVRNGDAQVQRVTVDFQPTQSGDNQHPWEYIDSLSVYDGSKKVGDVSAGSRSDWSQENDDGDHSGSLDFYTIDIPVNDIVRDGDSVELSIRADAQNTIDSTNLNQTFKVQVPSDGIRALDAAGIQQYVGDGTEVTLGFNTAQNGDLTVRESSDDPAAGVLVADNTDISDDFDVLKFEIKNSDDADALLTDLTVNVATSTGGTAANITDIIRRATLTVDGTDYDGDINSDNTIDFNDMNETLGANDTTDFTLSVQLYGQSGHFASSSEAMTFSVTSGNVSAEGADTGDAADISGTANGNQQSIALNGGINVAGKSMTGSQVYNSTTPASSYGTFTLKFDVTAIGDDVYVPKTVADGATVASTTYTGVVVLSNLNASTTSSTVTSSMTSTADSDNSLFYVVHDGDTETFTVNVTIDPTATGDFQVGLDKVRFSSTDANLNSLQTLNVDQSSDEFQTDSVNVRNS